MSLTAEQIAQAADLLVGARSSGTPMEALPAACRPTGQADAEAIGAAVLARIGSGPIGGYKIGFISQAAVGADGYFGPMVGKVYAANVLASPATVARASVPNPVIEAEIAYRLAKDLPPIGRPYTTLECLDAVDSALLMVEVANVSYTEFLKVGTPSLIADNGLGHTLVAGPDIADWRAADLAGFAIEVAFDGAVVSQGLPARARPAMADALGWTVNHATARGETPAAGQVISCGTHAVPRPLGDATEIVARYAGAGEVVVRFE